MSGGEEDSEWQGSMCMGRGGAGNWEVYAVGKEGQVAEKCMQGREKKKNTTDGKGENPPPPS